MTMQKIWKLRDFGGSDQLELSQAEIPNASDAQVIVNSDLVNQTNQQIFKTLERQIFRSRRVLRTMKILRKKTVGPEGFLLYKP